MSPDVRRFIRTATFATAVALSSGGSVDAQSDLNEPSKGTNIEYIDQLEAGRRQAIKAAEQFLEIDSGPRFESVLENAFQNPETHIEVVGPLGAEEFYVPDAFSFFIYDDPIDPERPANFRTWSALVILDNYKDQVHDIEVAVQLNHVGQIYTGEKDRLLPTGMLPLSTKALQADYLFKLPDEMEMLGWLPDFDDPTGSTLIRTYANSEFILTQSIGLSNVISLLIEPVRR